MDATLDDSVEVLFDADLERLYYPLGRDGLIPILIAINACNNGININNNKCLEIFLFHYLLIRLILLTYYFY